MATIIGLLFVIAIGLFVLGVFHVQVSLALIMAAMCILLARNTYLRSPTIRYSFFVTIAGLYFFINGLFIYGAWSDPRNFPPIHYIEGLIGAVIMLACLGYAMHLSNTRT